MAQAGSADLPDGLSEIFFRKGLDHPNQLEMSCKIRLRAHRIFAPFGSPGGPGRGAIAPAYTRRAVETAILRA
jgi:hypothetical protein